MKELKRQYWNRKNISFFVLFTLVGFNTDAQTNKKFVVVETLDQDWLVYSDSKNEFSPFVSELFNPPYLHFLLSLNKYDDYHLALSVPEKSSIFIENKIVNYTDKARVFYLSIDSLKNDYEQNDILVTIFSEHNLPQVLQTSIVDFNPSKGLDESGIGLNSEIRTQNKFKDFNIISVLIVFIIGALVRNLQNNVFGEYFDFKKIFDLKPKSDVLYSTSLLSLQNLAFLFLYGITLGFSFCNLLIWINPDTILRLGVSGTYGITFIAFLISIFFMLLMILKYPLISIISRIFLFRKAKTVHFFEYLRFTFLISIVLLLSSMVNNFSDGVLLNEYMNLVVGLIMILFVARSILVYLKLNNLQSFRKLHLFSYLCSTEIIPLIILLKIFKTYIGVF